MSNAGMAERTSLQLVSPTTRAKYRFVADMLAAKMTEKYGCGEDAAKAEWERCVVWVKEKLADLKYLKGDSAVSAEYYVERVMSVAWKYGHVHCMNISPSPPLPVVLTARQVGEPRSPEHEEVIQQRYHQEEEKRRVQALQDQKRREYEARVQAETVARARRPAPAPAPAPADGAGGGRGDSRQQQPQQRAGTKRPADDDDDESPGDSQALVLSMSSLKPYRPDYLPSDMNPAKRIKPFAMQGPIPGSTIGASSENNVVREIGLAATLAASLSRSGMVNWMVAPVESRALGMDLVPLTGESRYDQQRILNARDKEGNLVNRDMQPAPGSAQARPPSCRNCGFPGHKTGECAKSSPVGDTQVDPFCDTVSSDLHWLASGNEAEGCGELQKLLKLDNLTALFKTFVVDRRRKPCLQVAHRDLCFVGLTLRYAEVFTNGHMPPAMKGMWPYTKNDAVKYGKRLKKVYVEGIEAMPPSELESVAFAEIKKAYEEGRLLPQVMDTKPHPRAREPKFQALSIEPVQGSAS